MEVKPSTPFVPLMILEKNVNKIIGRSTCIILYLKDLRGCRKPSICASMDVVMVDSAAEIGSFSIS